MIRASLHPISSSAQHKDQKVHPHDRTTGETKGKPKPSAFYPKGKMSQKWPATQCGFWGGSPKRLDSMFPHQLSFSSHTSIPTCHLLLEPCPKILCVHPCNATGPHFWELRWSNHISLAELKESITHSSHLRLQGTFREGFLISQTFRGLAWRTWAPSPWNSTQRITSGSRLSQAELQSNWRMEKCCQRPSCLLPPPTVSSLSGKMPHE